MKKPWETLFLSLFLFLVFIVRNRRAVRLDLGMTFSVFNLFVSSIILRRNPQLSTQDHSESGPLNKHRIGCLKEEVRQSTESF